MRLIAAFLVIFALGGALPVQAADRRAPVTATEVAKEPAAEKKSGPPQFAVETFPSQLFWLVVSFGTLYVLLSGAALPRIHQGIAARAAHIHNLLTDAQRVRNEAEEYKNNMTSTADTAYQQAHDILNRAVVAAQEISGRRNHELEAVLLAKQKSSEERIAQARREAVQSVRDAAADLLPLITQKLAGLKLSEGQINAALAEVQSTNDNGHAASRGVA